MRDRSFWFSAPQEALSWLIPVECAGCGAPDLALCGRCAQALQEGRLQSRRIQGLHVVSAMAYRGPVVGIMRALKTDGRTSLARPLGASLRRALAGAAHEFPRGDGAGKAVVVPVPTSPAAFRRRGYRVVELLIRHAGWSPSRLLRAGTGSLDQRLLRREERAHNARGMFRLASAPPLPPDRIVLVDDVVTTGATLVSAAQVLTDAGACVVGAITVASTPLRTMPDGSGDTANSYVTGE